MRSAPLALGAAAALLGCGAPPAPPATPPPTTPVARATPAPAPPPALPDAGPWTRPGIAALAFCPGDAELVAIDEAGWLTRWRVADGVRIGATLLAPDLAALTADVPPPKHPPGRWRVAAPLARIECRADGAALVVAVLERDEDWTETSTVPGPNGEPLAVVGHDTTTVRIPMLVDRAGVITRAATHDALEARFGAGGEPLVLSIYDAIASFDDRGALHEIARVEHDREARLGRDGDRVEYAGKLRLVRDGRSLALPGGAGDAGDAVDTVDDGVVVQSAMAVHAWPLRGGKAAKALRLLDATGTDVRASAAGRGWFLAVDADGALIRARRPGLRIDRIEHPCGGVVGAGAIALAHDEGQLAAACDDDRIRLIPLE